MTKHKYSTIAIFNHKGGVGKTTLTVNVAARVAAKGKRVLLVDSDPQCNLSAYLIEEGLVDSLLDNSDGKNGATIWSALKPVAEASGPFRSVEPLPLGNDETLLAGDVRLVEFEQELTQAWSDCFALKAKGFRATTALSELVNSICIDNDIDYVFYDSGPNIGPLNRVILLDCDYFIVPVACDLFSLRAIKTLGNTLAKWISEWMRITQLAPDDVYLLSGFPKLLGYIPQRFRVYRNAPSYQFASFIPKIEKSIFNDLVTPLRRIDSKLVPFGTSALRLGDVKDFAGLASASQSQGVEFSQADYADESQTNAAYDAFEHIATRILNRIP